MTSLRTLLLAPLAACALAAPAAAATPVYDVGIVTSLSGTASGDDGDGWTSASTFSAAVSTHFTGVPGTDSEGPSEAVATTPPLVTDTALTQNYRLVTVLKTITWNCAPDGEATAGTPGSIHIQRIGDVGHVSAYLADDTVTAARACTGFSSFANTIDISRESLTVPPTTFSWPEFVRDGYVRIPVDRMVQCGEWTIYQTACALRLTGSMLITRTVTADAPTPEETPEPEPTPTGEQPAESGDDVSSPPRPATPIQVKGKVWHHGKGARVTVECGTCAGRVSASAGGKRIGTKRFTTTDKPIIVIYGKGGRAAARNRGSVIIDVDAGGRSSSYRMRTR